MGVTGTADRMRFAFDRSWAFDVPVNRLWSLFSDTGSFSTWWPWLRSFEPVPLEIGSRTRCSIGPPLPYLLNVGLEVLDLAPERFVEVAVSGDAEGIARLELSAENGGPGSAARLVWELEVRRPMLRMAASVARPLLQWGHDWVVSNGVAQFRRAALGAS